MYFYEIYLKNGLCVTFETEDPNPPEEYEKFYNDNKDNIEDICGGHAPD